MELLGELLIRGGIYRRRACPRNPKLALVDLTVSGRGLKAPLANPHAMGLERTLLLGFSVLLDLRLARWLRRNSSLSPYLRR
jgi:hypothetical protein